MREIGRVVWLQVQTEPLKRGSSLNQTYDPAPLQPVETLELTDRGIVGLLANGRRLLDVHHAGHPRSRYRESNAISFNFEPNYRLMQARFGDHLAPGAAGENILIALTGGDDVGVPTIDQLGAGLALRSAGGRHLVLDSPIVAAPCLPFGRFALGDQSLSASLLKETLQFLDSGRRGYYATFAGEAALVHIGDTVLLRL